MDDLSITLNDSVDSNLTANEDDNNNRKKHGRPSGATNDSKRLCSEKIEAAKNNIILNYVKIIDNDDIGNISKKGLFDCLVKEQVMQNNLPDTFDFPFNTAISRIRRGNITACGRVSPLQAVESQFIHILLSMSKINKCLRPTESL